MTRCQSAVSWTVSIVDQDLVCGEAETKDTESGATLRRRIDL